MFVLFSMVICCFIIGVFWCLCLGALFVEFDVSLFGLFAYLGLVGGYYAFGVGIRRVLLFSLMNRNGLWLFAFVCLVLFVAV